MRKLTLKYKRIKDGDALIIATDTGYRGRAFNMYRRRWAMECLFADAKTRGLNLEDTHVTNPDKATERWQRSIAKRPVGKAEWACIVYCALARFCSALEIP